MFAFKEPSEIKAVSGGRSIVVMNGWEMVPLQHLLEQQSTREGTLLNNCVCVFLHLHVCCCALSVVVVNVYHTQGKRIHQIRFHGWNKRRHNSPFLDQQDGHQHQQNEDKNTSTYSSYFHHSVCLFGRVRDDFRFLCRI